jgi:parvulin-like peptidyl-prolyl isomerase
MASKDARRRKPRTRPALLTLWILGGVFIAASLFFTVRHFWGAGSASADAPVQRSSSGYRAADSSTASATSRSAPDEATPSAGGATSGIPAVRDTKKLTVMAVVNGEQITRQELAHECMRRFGEEVLETILNKHLILDACQKRNITITNQDVQTEIAYVAQKFNLSTDAYMSMLQRERGITPDKYAKDMIWPTLALRALAADQIKVTREEVNRALESELGPKVKVRMISTLDPEKAKQIRAQAMANPDDFGQLAKTYSEDPNSASTYGMIPPIRRHVGDPTVEQAAFALEPGEISPVISAANQYLILKCETQVPGINVTDEVRRSAEPRVIDFLREQKMRSAAERIFQQLQDETKVVNVYNDPQLQQQMPGVAATVGGKAITIAELAEECLQRHGDDVLGGEINRKLLNQELKRRGQTVEQADIDDEIVRAADAYGCIKADGSPDLEKWLSYVTQEQEITVDLYVRDVVWPSVALKKLVAEKVEVTDEDMNKGFEANYGERVQVMAIVLGNQRQAQQVWEMARGNPTDDFFGQLASQYSIEPISKAQLGKVPPIQRYGGQPAIEEEAFRLQAGELSGIIAVNDKFIILRCLGRTKPEVDAEDFEAVRDILYKDIHEKKLRMAMAREFDRLKEVAQIDDFLAGTSHTPQRTNPANFNGRSGAEIGGRIPFERTDAPQRR